MSTSSISAKKTSKFPFHTNQELIWMIRDAQEELCKRGGNTSTDEKIRSNGIDPKTVEAMIQHENQLKNPSE